MELMLVPNTLLALAQVRHVAGVRVHQWLMSSRTPRACPTATRALRGELEALGQHVAS